MRNPEQLLEIARKIQELNPTFLISGSLALHFNGVKLRSDPKDIDVWQPLKTEIVLPEKSRFYDGGDGYEESAYDRKSYIIDEAKVDFFIGFEDCDTFDYSEHYKVIQGVKFLLPDEILKFKISHAVDKNYEGIKHKLDLIHILVNS